MCEVCKLGCSSLDTFEEPLIFMVGWTPQHVSILKMRSHKGLVKQSSKHQTSMFTALPVGWFVNIDWSLGHCLHVSQVRVFNQMLESP